MAYKFQEGLAKLDGVVSASLAIVSKTSFSGSGDVAVTGNVHAAEYYGGGGNLTGISSDAVDVTASAGNRGYPLVFTEAAQTAGTLGLALDASLVFNPSTNLLTAPGRVITDDTTDATTNADGSLQTDGGLSVAKAIFNSTAATLAAASGVVTMGSTTAATVSAAGIVNVNNATEATSATDGSLQTDGGLSVVKSAVIGDDLDLLSNGAILNIGVAEKWTATHANANDTLTVSSGHRLAFGDAADYISGDGTDLKIVSSGDVDITGDTDVVGGLSSTQATTLASAAGATAIGSTTAVGITAAGIVNVNNATDATTNADGSLQTDGGLSVTKAIFNSTAATLAAASGVVTMGSTTAATVSAVGILNVNNATEATSATDGSLQTDGGLSVVKSAVIGDDLDLLSNAAVFKVGSDQPFTLTHANASNTLLATANHRLAFGDAGDYITGDGTDISIVGSNEINLAATTIDINGAIHVDSTMGLAADADLLTFANAQLTVAGDLLATEGTISGASTIQAVGNVYLGGQLAVSGGLKFEIETVTAATELTASSAGMYHLVSGGTAAITVRLPSASAGEEYQYVIKRHALMSGNVVISSSGIDKDPAKQFDGENSITLESPGASVFLISDGTMWNIF
jgi:hypothetical protein